ncbi:MAG: porin family protein [Gammaproteobacteria bacterium]|nr:porin family protein [Gammaproteobacteria bacterium]
MKKHAIALSVASLFSVSTFAGDYLGVNYKLVEVSAGSLSAEPAVLEVKYGKMFTNEIALEGRLGFGIADDDDLEADSFVGVFGAYHLDLDAIVTPYGLLGYSRTKLSEGSASESRSDISYGFGANIEIDKKSSINVEYTQLFDKDGLEGTSFSAGWHYSF